MSEGVERGRSAYARRAWDEAWRCFAEADHAEPLAVEDLQRMGWAAALTARDADMVAAFERVHQARLAADERLGAARAAFWVAMRLFSLGEVARASGWFGRAERLVEGRMCAERGYLLIPRVLRRLASGELDAAFEEAVEMARVGMEFGEPDLLAWGRNFQGRALLRRGEVEPALALLDEAMVAATAGELSPLVAGIVCCNIIDDCRQVFALERAREWTAALTAWCEAQPELVPFAGVCCVHRCEVMVLSGAWPRAADEVRRAEERLGARTDTSLLAEARYQGAEIHRLRGEHAAAEEGYAQTVRLGGDPLPGLALLRLAEGRVAAASAALSRALDGTPDPLRRARLLPAAVEVRLAAGDLAGAEAACAELDTTASAWRTGLLAALAGDARGAILLARGEPRSAVEPLRLAAGGWQRLGTPYHAARTRVRLGEAFAALGDSDGAAFEREAARAVFAELGARPDLDAMAPPPTPAFGLTPREREVLQHLATGKTNKAIARALFVSGKTVDRHVSNIFAKLDLPSRAAATAWAYEHGLVPRG